MLLSYCHHFQTNNSVMTIFREILAILRPKIRSSSLTTTQDGSLYCFDAPAECSICTCSSAPWRIKTQRALWLAPFINFPSHNFPPVLQMSSATSSRSRSSPYKRIVTYSKRGRAPLLTPPSTPHGRQTRSNSSLDSPLSEHRPPQNKEDTIKLFSDADNDSVEVVAKKQTPKKPTVSSLIPCLSIGSFS